MDESFSPPSSPEDYFSSLAEFYDYILGSSSGLDPDTEFYLEITDDGKFLEVGCGTGRILIELLERGVDAYGIDVSEEMVEVVKEKAEHRKLELSIDDRLRVADMKEYDFESEFSTIVVPSNNFLYNLSIEEQLDTLENAYDHLDEDGRLVLDFYAPDFDIVCENFGETHEETIEKDCKEFRHLQETNFVDEVDQVIEVERKLLDGDEVVLQSTVRQKFVSRTQFELLVKLSSFSEYDVHGDYDHEPLESVEQQMLWVLEK